MSNKTKSFAALGEMLRYNAFPVKKADAVSEQHDSVASKLASELNITELCANDVIYLRTRHRHTQALENELIALHKAGTPPNMCEFGCTKETGEALMNTAKGKINKPTIKKWNIWIEGYSATGQQVTATFKGSFEGETFKDACIAWVATLNEHSKTYFSEETLTYWSCKMFDNETDARKSFG